MKVTMPKPERESLFLLTEDDFATLQREWDKLLPSRKRSLLWDIERRAVYQELADGYGISYRLAVLITHLARRGLLTAESLKTGLRRK